MKFCKLVLLFIASLFTINLFAQQAKSAVGVTVGVNYSDVNYGTEFLYDYLPREDYLKYSSSGDGHYAYNFGVNFTQVLLNKFSASLGLIYTVLEYKIDGSVSDLKSTVIRPPSPTIPVSIDGVVKYSFMDIQLGLNYSFNRSLNKGLFIVATANSMFHLNTNWYLNEIYEDQSEGVNKNIIGIDQPDYNTLWFLGLGTGYHFRLEENLSLTPFFGMKYGLNPLVDETLEPTIISFELALNRWF